MIGHFDRMPLRNLLGEPDLCSNFSTSCLVDDLQGVAHVTRGFAVVVMAFHSCSVFLALTATLVGNVTWDLFHSLRFSLYHLRVLLPVYDLFFFFFFPQVAYAQRFVYVYVFSSQPVTGSGVFFSPTSVSAVMFLYLGIQALGTLFRVPLFFWFFFLPLVGLFCCQIKMELKFVDTQNHVINPSKAYCKFIGKSSLRRM